MATTKNGNSLLNEMFAAGLYKRNQGRRVRQWTAVGIALLFIFGASSLYNNLLVDLDRPIKLGIAVGLGAVGTWFAYRVVNYPRFADFLISVQAEMDKVTWVSTKELIRSTIVVIVSMVFIGLLLYFYDALWAAVFKFLGFLRL